MSTNIQHRKNNLALEAYAAVRKIQLSECSVMSKVIKPNLSSALQNNKNELLKWEVESIIKKELADGNCKLNEVNQYIKFVKEYRSNVRSLPEMIRTNSLITTWSFLMRKAAGGKNAWTSLRTDLTEKLRKAGAELNINDIGQNIDEYLIKTDMHSYMTLSNVLFNYTLMLSKYAEALLLSDEIKKSIKNSNHEEE